MGRDAAAASAAAATETPRERTTSSSSGISYCCSVADPDACPAEVVEIILKGLGVGMGIEDLDTRFQVLCVLDGPLRRFATEVLVVGQQGQ